MATAEQRKESNLNFQKRRIAGDAALAHLDERIAALERMAGWLIEVSLRGNKPTGEVKAFLDSLKNG